jgi:hypothetical protein
MLRAVRHSAAAWQHAEAGSPPARTPGQLPAQLQPGPQAALSPPVHLPAMPARLVAACSLLLLRLMLSTRRGAGAPEWERAGGTTSRYCQYTAPHTRPQQSRAGDSVLLSAQGSAAWAGHEAEVVENNAISHQRRKEKQHKHSCPHACTCAPAWGAPWQAAARQLPAQLPQQQPRQPSASPAAAYAAGPSHRRRPRSQRHCRRLSRQQRKLKGHGATAAPLRGGSCREGSSLQEGKRTAWVEAAAGT